MTDEPNWCSCTVRLDDEGRPSVCRDFPWYGEHPIERRARSLDKGCSYLLDVPPAMRPEGARPLIPIEVVTQDRGRGVHGDQDLTP